MLVILSLGLIQLAFPDVINHTSNLSVKISLLVGHELSLNLSVTIHEHTSNVLLFSPRFLRLCILDTSLLVDSNHVVPSIDNMSGLRDAL